MKKYQEIYQQLKEKIRNRMYPPQTALPTEKDLQEQYGVSRDTVRKALAILTEEGLIQRVQGRGSVVLGQDLLPFPVSGLTSYQELTAALQLDSKTQVLSLERVVVTEDLADLTGFDLASQVWKVVRTRSIEGQVYLIDTDYLTVDDVPTLTQEIASQSIYAYLEGELGLDIAYAHKEITVEETSHTDRSLMQTDDAYLVLVCSKVYLGNTRQFQYTESRHKMDKFRFVDFARRKHSL